ncbi:hypothetical protein ACFPPD_17285 [Cohnella suwonensis]|uniref:Uncharacterized protein n=1 Tax=Cohnella suwonensis TaxID=696072 RepID=A0ABW0M0D1_9BACL
MTQTMDDQFRASGLERPSIGPERVALTLHEKARHGGPAFETADDVAGIFDFLDKHLGRADA